MPKPRKSPDEGPLWPSRWICAALDLSPGQLGKLTSDGILTKASYGRYAPIPTINAYLKHVTAEQKDDPLTRERTRWLASRAALGEVELWRARAGVELEVERLLSSVLLVARSLFLGIGHKLAMRLASEAKPAVCCAMVDEEIKRAMTAMADFRSWDEFGMPVIEEESDASSKEPDHLHRAKSGNGKAVNNGVEGIATARPRRT